MCNHTPVELEVSVARPRGNDAMVPDGWYILEPGECARPETMRSFSGGTYFRRAQVSGADRVSDWLGGDFDTEGWTSICTSRRKFEGDKYNERLNV